MNGKVWNATAAIQYTEKQIELKKEWFEEECRQALAQIIFLRLEMLKKKIQEAAVKYKGQRQKCKTLMREKKRKLYETTLEGMEDIYIYKNKEIRIYIEESKMEKVLSAEDGLLQE